MTVVPAILLWWLFQQTTPVKATLVNYLFPIVALAAGIVWFNESVPAGLGVGGLILLVGVAVAETGTKEPHASRAMLRPCPDVGGFLPALPSAQTATVDFRSCRGFRAGQPW